MEGLVSLLIFAGLFYLMMRFGCGAHMIHGHSSEKTEASHIDPVCQMKVDQEKGYGMMHKGILHRFCSRQCMDQFEKEPEKYLSQNQKGNSHE